MKRVNYLLIVCIGLGLLQMGCGEGTRTYNMIEDFEGGTTLPAWVYKNNPTGSSTGLREGGFGQVSGDTADDGSGPLEIVVDPDDSSNHVLAWTFDGSQPNSITPGGGSKFDLFCLIQAADWSNSVGIMFDVKTKRNGGGSDRDFIRLEARIDQGDGTDLFDDGGEAWKALKLDVGHDGLRIDDNDHKIPYNIVEQYGLYSPHGIWPQTEFEAQKAGWSTFEFNFDEVTDTRAGFYFNPRQYDIGKKWAYGSDIYGETQVGSGFNVERNNIESFRLTLYWLETPSWIGASETITIYIDNLQLIGVPGPFGF